MVAGKLVLSLAAEKTGSVFDALCGLRGSVDYS